MDPKISQMYQNDSEAFRQRMKKRHTETCVTCKIITDCPKNVYNGQQCYRCIQKYVCGIDGCTTINTTCYRWFNKFI